jgi:hypothetical protein
LKIEPNTTFQQMRPFSTPLSEKMTMWSLTGFVAVRPAQRFPYPSLGMQWNHKNQNQNGS